MLQRYLDRIAITLSATCAIHCVVFPIFASLIPIFSTTLIHAQIIHQFWFHQFILIFILPTSILAIFFGVANLQAATWHATMLVSSLLVTANNKSASSAPASSNGVTMACKKRPWRLTSTILICSSPCSWQARHNSMRGWWGATWAKDRPKARSSLVSSKRAAAALTSCNGSSLGHFW